MTVRPIKILMGAAAIAAVSSQVQAQMLPLDMTPDTSRIVSDPLYLPLQGQFLSTSSYSYGSIGQDTFGNGHVKLNAARIDTNTLNEALEYGLTDDISLHADIGYVPSRDVNRKQFPGSIDRSSSGWTDPDFGVTWRALDQNAYPVSLDLRADYSPDAFPAKSATDDDGGFVARGGQMVDLGATVGHETRDFTLAGTFDAQYLDQRTIDNQNTGGASRTDSLWNYSVGLATQTRFSDVMSLNAGYSHTFSNNADTVNTFNGLEHIAHNGDVNNLNVALNYHFVPNTVVGSVGYEHNFYNVSRNQFVDPTQDTAIANKNEDIVGVKLRYVMP